MTLKSICLLLFFITKCKSSSNEGDANETVTVISNSTAMFISFGLTAIIMTIGFIIIELSKRFCCCCIKTSEDLETKATESRELVAK